MEEIEYGKTDYIDTIEVEMSQDIAYLAEKYFKQSEFEVSDIEILGYNEDYGYVLKGKHNNETFSVGFSDYFVSINNESKIDPIWVNIIAKKLHCTDLLSKDLYLNEVHELLDLLEENKDSLGVNADDISKLNDCLLSIQLNQFNPKKQVLSETEKLITHLSLDQ